MNLFRMPSTFGLRARLTLLIESLIVILVLITGTVSILREKRTLEIELHKRGFAVAFDLAKFTVRPMITGDLPTLRRFVNHTMEQDYVLYVMLLDPKGKVVMHSDLDKVGKILEPDRYDLDRETQLSRRKFTQLPEQDELHCDLSAPITAADTRLGTVLLGYSYRAVEKEIFQAQRQIFSLGVIIIIVGGLVAYFLANFIASPIKRIIIATQAVANGNLNQSLSINRTDEIGTLVNSFNKMAEELGKHRRHLQNLVQDRTIELETANKQLKQEINERKLAQEKLRQSRQRLRELALHIQHVKEEEAKRIAREIHDELGQALTALKMDLYWIVPRLPDEKAALHDKIEKMGKLIDTTIHSVRRISSELRPGILDDFGLSAAIEWQSNDFWERTGLQCDFISDPESIVLDPDRSVAIFRIFQETLTNIVRHANATVVDVSLEETDREICLMVRDNGKGISEHQIRDSRSFGVIGIKERVNDLVGQLRIHGQPDRGSTVSVRIPKGEQPSVSTDPTH
jgi:signal transduction histidine kinase